MNEQSAPEASPPASTRNPDGARITLTGLGGLPLVRPGDDIAELIIRALDGMGERLNHGDVLVIAQKIVSKSEGRFVDLTTVEPSERAVRLAAAVDKDARLVELILEESSEVVAYRPGVLIVALASGVVLANAGIDHSNVGGESDEAGSSDDHVLLLPEDPDRSCASLRETLMRRCGVQVGVVINDSLGRAWRNGTVGAALGVSGIEPLLDLVGRPDLFGRPLQTTQVALADELAAAASLVMGQANEGRPVVLVRGLGGAMGRGSAKDLVRNRDEDLFR